MTHWKDVIYRRLPVSQCRQTVVERGEKTSEGELIVAVSLPWYEIIAAINRDPRLAFELSDRKWEDLIAGAYERARFDEVILTPRSGDAGRDVIATKRGVGTIRIVDLVKAYGPGHLVTADDVRALFGVVAADQGVSKGPDDDFGLRPQVAQ